MKAFDQALELHRAQDDHVAAGRVLIRLALVLHRLGEPGTDEALAEARELLEAHTPGPELVAAHTYTAGRCTLTSRYPEAVAAAERAFALAAELDLPEPAFALHWRGLALCCLGDAEGVEDMRRALRLAVEQGEGREAAVILGNLAWVASVYEGPQASLDAVVEAVSFCERRGITELALNQRCNALSSLAELGRTAEALAEAAPLADRLEAAGDIAYLSARELQLRLLAERGTPELAPAPDALVAAARATGLSPYIAQVFTAAAQALLAQRRPEQAQALLDELDRLDAVRPDLAPVLPSLLRVARVLDDASLAQRLTTDIEPVTPLDEHAVAAARAQLAEAAGDHAAAAELYEQAADRWQKFGNLPERAYALLGQGRCLATLGKPEAEAPLRDARDLFTTLAYQPALAESRALLGESEAAAV
jgi:tetratricopeptide (TPR) repeat protein